ncbi:FkbM family methyltransferase [Thetidibacter halocola]|uniref:FkbM family methyltransferase n=1 Tax=Thetidibacter halocola TaxID=2827239 RepID=A0A8J7WFR1_9RHOB|nr:FkbM family methyltransferase [Thetidibacter halocola]MBS0124541.1 FkbM family methyltransferase [Thetidibacter halocola]
MTGGTWHKAALAAHGLAYRLRPPTDLFRRSTLSHLRKLPPQEAAEAANAVLRACGVTGQHYTHDAESGLFACHAGDRVHRFSEYTWMRTLSAGLEKRAEKLIREYHLAQVPLADGDSIVEVGANVGDLTLALRHLGKSVHLTSFEPSPRDYQALALNIAAAAPLITGEARNIALWKDNSAALTFYLKTATADSSILPIEGYDKVIEVPAIRLDEAIPRGAYRLLKLEAEGAEPEVLEGAGDSIRQFQYVTADVGYERGVSQDTTLPQVTNFLLKHGFEMQAIGRRRLVVLYRNPSWSADA